MTTQASTYRGILAVTPDEPIYLEQVATLWATQQRTLQQQGTLILRLDNIEHSQKKTMEQYASTLELLHWLGLNWQEGPDIGGRFVLYQQNQRYEHYFYAWLHLLKTGMIYPSVQTDEEIEAAWQAAESPIDTAGEPIFPRKLRPPLGLGTSRIDPGEVNWRFRVPERKIVEIEDVRLGKVQRTAGVDFGDFLVWKKTDWPSPDMAAMIDNHALQVTEVVGSEAQILAAIRQQMLYDAMELQAPRWHHLSETPSAEPKEKSASKIADCQITRPSVQTLRNQGHTSAQVLKLAARGFTTVL